MVLTQTNYIEETFFSKLFLYPSVSQVVNNSMKLLFYLDLIVTDNLRIGWLIY